MGNLFEKSIFLQFRLVTRVIQKWNASPLKSESELIYKKAIYSIWCNTFEEWSSHRGEQWGVLDSVQSVLWNHAPHPSKSLGSWEIVLCTYQHAVICSSWERILTSTLFSTDINVVWPLTICHHWHCSDSLSCLLDHSYTDAKTTPSAL